MNSWEYPSNDCPPLWNPFSDPTLHLHIHNSNLLWIFHVWNTKLNGFRKVDNSRFTSLGERDWWLIAAPIIYEHSCITGFPWARLHSVIQMKANGPAQCRLQKPVSPGLHKFVCKCSINHLKYVLEKIYMLIKFWSGNLVGRDCVGILGIDGRLKCGVGRTTQRGFVRMVMNLQFP
jgi:hypothetical protein